MTIETGKRFGPPAIICIVALFIPMILSNAYYLHLINMALIYMIAVYGLNFISGMAGQTNFGMAGVFGLGAYASAMFTTKLGLPAWFGLVPAIILGFAVGIILGYPSLRVKGLFLALVTLAFTEVLRYIENNWAFVGGALGIKNVPNFFVFGVELKTSEQFYYLILAVVGLMSILTYRIIHSKWGRAFLAVRDNSDAVESCGISLAQAKITAFTLASVYGAIAGAFYAGYNNYVSATAFTLEMTVLFVVMMMFGGLASMYGVIIGTIIITLLPELLRFLGDYYQLVYALIVMLFAIFLPNGIWSVVRGLQARSDKQRRKRQDAGEIGRRSAGG
ncbi:MAG: branched-chain amino acid ABC transporter permease [Clostridiales Family XIII bacterium]|nr:branched-chain amino acid ABC transporter permease [Clostridiales Family XIII bacterium]